MKIGLSALVLFALLHVSSRSVEAGTPFAGRWDITVTPQASADGAPKNPAQLQPYPDWLEVVEQSGKFDVRVQPRAGSVHPVNEVKLAGSKLLLVISPAAKGPAVTWELEVKNNRLTGVQKRGEAVAAQIAGVRAPALKGKPPKAWTDPEPLFNGKDLTGWEAFPAGAVNHWVAQDGVLVDTDHGASLKTTRTFNDFKLHIEFNCPDGGNSGIYLRGRDEIQVAYEKPGVEDKFHDMGAVYGFVAPTAEVPRTPGTWESFDVTLIGRYVTIVRNGVKTVDNQEIAGPSGGALDANEAEPGPFYLQGDHTGNMKYRNIMISVPKK
uniref:3-keto-alpha-glucoside-1,2-lyase/3-keto-2-hydroxy-glucal hydratase domain-containing protein n=1 Tax=Solibacter usitatus (strain Ellin6076) TaxID=234267 RepID=Q01TF3_SOLUE